MAEEQAGTVISPDYQTDARMALKRRAIPLPDMQGRRVLDVGCDMAYWTFLAADLGARRVVGIDRNRKVKGVGHVDLVAYNEARVGDRPVEFIEANVGVDWPLVETRRNFDVILLLSVYHHIVANAGEHAAVWSWLRQLTGVGGVVIFEGPLDRRDTVVRRTVPDHIPFSHEDISTAALEYFNIEALGPALHAPHRVVWRLTRRAESLY